MAPIEMPPHGMTPMDWKVCAASNDPLTIRLVYPSFVDHSIDGLFNPELPANRDSLLPAGVYGPYTPLQQSGEVVVGIFDDTTKKLFIMTVTIKPACP